ncbi:alpha/beta hydrolase [Aliidiomarina minuta]|uniref:Alpha/beta hydrolase n=1 Tax=Aliidiomarina minuta TaxID=880057 RepID=A0A432W3X8_9GAMM|nr:alpha/beta hydrolase [Aliidiomarina minuta]RUO23979.1 alpha/beta hydrolase [Aliidiomarina minuta]
MRKVIFSHGKESGPWGTKIKRLAEIARRFKLDVESVDYSDTMDPDIRAQRLLNTLHDETAEECILVGSSMGGYVTLQAAKEVPVAASFVLAPAIYMPGYEDKAPNHTLQNLAIVHGWDDEIIPVEHSIRFAREQNCTLHLVNDDHRLINSLPQIELWFSAFLNQLGLQAD